MHHVPNCPKKCSPCPDCYDLTAIRLREILYLIDNKISDYTEDLLCRLKWGYGCNSVDKGDVAKLLAYKDTIQNYYKSLIGDYEFCLCPSEIQAIIEKVLDIVDSICCKTECRTDITITESTDKLWLLNNPGCVAYYGWERGLINACPKIGITIKRVDNACDFVAKINLIKKKCEFLTVASAIKKSCEMDTNIDITKKDCDILTPKMKASLISCGMLDVKYNIETKETEIAVDEDNSILLSELLCIDAFSTEVDQFLLEKYTGGVIDKEEYDRLLEEYT